MLASCCISPPFGGLSTTRGLMTYVLLTRAPLYWGRSPFSLDLHVLGAPLTFVLSQDQTLQLNPVAHQSARTGFGLGTLCHWHATAPRFWPREYCYDESTEVGSWQAAAELLTTSVTASRRATTSTLNTSLFIVSLANRQRRERTNDPRYLSREIGLSFQGPWEARCLPEGCAK